jgi:hypothetical protein
MVLVGGVAGRAGPLGDRGFPSGDKLGKVVGVGLLRASTAISRSSSAYVGDDYPKASSGNHGASNIRGFFPSILTMQGLRPQIPFAGWRDTPTF